MGLNATERQRRYKSKKRRTGHKMVQVWLKSEVVKKLKRLIVHSDLDHIEGTQGRIITDLINQAEAEALVSIEQTHGKRSINRRAYLAANDLSSQDIIENGFKIYR